MGDPGNDDVPSLHNPECKELHKLLMYGAHFNIFDTIYVLSLCISTRHRKPQRTVIFALMLQSNVLLLCTRLHIHTHFDHHFYRNVSVRSNSTMLSKSVITKFKKTDLSLLLKYIIFSLPWNFTRFLYFYNCSFLNKTVL